MMGPLSLLLVSPLLGALLLLFVPRSASRWVALLSSVPPLVVALWLLRAYDTTVGGFQHVELLPLLPSLGIQFKLGVDGLLLPLVFLTAVIYTTAILL
jgi:NADH-quinone oxidoreductase subunit M